MSHIFTHTHSNRNIDQEKCKTLQNSFQRKYTVYYIKELLEKSNMSLESSRRKTLISFTPTESQNKLFTIFYFLKCLKIQGYNLSYNNTSVWFFFFFTRIAWSHNEHFFGSETLKLVIIHIHFKLPQILCDWLDGSDVNACLLCWMWQWKSMRITKTGVRVCVMSPDCRPNNCHKL